MMGRRPAEWEGGGKGKSAEKFHAACLIRPPAQPITEELGSAARMSARRESSDLCIWMREGIPPFIFLAFNCMYLLLVFMTHEDKEGFLRSSRSGRFFFFFLVCCCSCCT